MIVLISGASHVGKTALAQRLLEKYRFPYLSIDHLKMGLIRSGHTVLTPESNDEELTGYLWPIVCEMVKTAIENRQNMIVEGCYIPFDWDQSFDKTYLDNIRYYCLVMSEDYIRNHFDDIKSYIVKDSYQYQVTKKYANSVDRRFFSSHTLLDPTFTDEKVSNFTWITENCFCVDISFVKHMALKSGRKVDDAMNDRFYFVKWDDSEDEIDNPTWKIVSMKEIVGNAE
jgi:hypothetical protein